MQRYTRGVRTMTRYGRLRYALGLLVLVLDPGFAGAQAPVGDVEREIDTQVWLPMLRASDRLDADGFLAVQSRDLVRVSIDRNEVYGFDRYSNEIRAGFARARERGVRRTSNMRFLTRTHSADLARETGIFRSEVTRAHGETRVSYTAFEMILRKEGGRWKLLVDQDTWRGGKITEQEYLNGKPLTSAAGESAPAPPTRPE